MASLMANKANKLKRKLKSAAGMSLIELIVGLAVSSVVSIMAAQFFSIAVRLHRSSTEISAIQKEAQTISSQLERAVMNAEEIYFFDSGSESYLLLGRAESSPTGESFTGEIFYYNRGERKYYIDADYRASAPKQTLFNTLRAQSEIGRIQNDDYLVSNKVEDIVYGLSEDIRDMRSLGNYTYAPTGAFTLSAELIMQYHESRSYEFSMRAMPRERISELTWND